MTGETTAPFYVIVDPSGGAEKVVATHGGYAAPAQFLSFMAKGATTDQAEKSPRQPESEPGARDQVRPAIRLKN